MPEPYLQKEHLHLIDHKYRKLFRLALALRHIGRAQKFAHLIRNRCWRVRRLQLPGFDPRAFPR